MAVRGIKRKLLMMVALLADVRNELSMHTAYKRFWWPEYKPQSIAQTVSRMIRIGDITKEVDKRGEVRLRLQAKGGRLLDEVLPFRKLQSRQWDKRWRLVVFDIPEKRKQIRDNLRKKLKQLGFGMWQKSVYVTPHDVMREMNEYLEENGLFPLVVCFESRRTGFGDDREFADEIFGTEELNEKYLEIVNKAEELEHLLNGKKVSPRAFEQELRKLWLRYVGHVETDPFLPFELLPKPWKAQEARRTLRRLAALVDT